MTPPATRRDDNAAGTAVEPRPAHNWRPTVVHGFLAWLLLGLALLAPLGGPLRLGVAIVGLFTAPVVPVALYCDYRQARAFGECSPGISAYVGNLAHDVVTTVTRRDSLGSEREEIRSC